MFRHGFRVSEAIGIRRNEVDLEHSRLWVRRLKHGLDVEHPIAGDELWAIKRYSLISGRRIRVLPIVDGFTREGLTLEVDFSLPAQRVVRALDDVAAVRGYPKVLRSDNGPEFVSHSLLGGPQSTKFAFTSSSPVSRRRTPTSKA